MNLRSIISYSSLSPPPSTPTTSSAVSKWKRVAGAPPTEAIASDASSQPSPMVVDSKHKSNKPVTVASEGAQAGSPLVGELKKQRGEF
jgi:hypothetical protein